MNKKGVNLLMENFVFILLVIVFVFAMFFAISRAGSQATLFEQIYAKQIALIIDKAEPGMEIEVDMFDVYRIAKKNKLSGNPVSIDNDLGKVNVRLVKGNGYEYFYFSDNNVVWDLNSDKKVLNLNIVEKINRIGVNEVSKNEEVLG